MIHFSAPSKTFLAGEYAVLSGGPALVLNTEPRFTFTAKPGTGVVCGIPENSPAWKWLLEQNEIVLGEWDIDFQDPHGGRGGFGASSAQFLFVHALTSHLRASRKSSGDDLDLEVLHSDYRSTCGGKTSGTDLLAQATGAVTRIVAGAAANMQWPYKDLDFVVVRTGRKTVTHEHVAELSLRPLRTLVSPAIGVVESFGTATAEDFLRRLRAFSAELRELGLQAPETMAFLADIERQPWCKAAKGCGALGADTLLAFFSENERPSVMGFFDAKGMEVVGGRGDLSSGLEMSWGEA